MKCVPISLQCRSNCVPSIWGRTINNRVESFTLPQAYGSGGGTINPSRTGVLCQNVVFCGLALNLRRVLRRHRRSSACMCVRHNVLTLRTTCTRFRNRQTNVVGFHVSLGKGPGISDKRLRERTWMWWLKTVVSRPTINAELFSSSTEEDATVTVGQHCYVTLPGALLLQN
jgi:hypothetical protein